MITKPQPAARPHGKPQVPLYPAGMVKRVMLGVEEFRTTLSARLKALSAGSSEEHTVVAMRNRPIGVLVPIEWYREASKKLGHPTEY